jgi:hypothetical protein
MKWQMCLETTGKSPLPKTTKKDKNKTNKTFSVGTGAVDTGDVDQ